MGDMRHVPDFLEFRRQHMETLFAKGDAALHAKANGWSHPQTPLHLVAEHGSSP